MLTEIGSMIASREEQIVCSKGHVGGSMARDIRDGETIGPRDIAVGDGGNHTLAGHCCKTCKETDGAEEGITRYSNGAYAVRTARGWIGNIK
jgi:hypothetical protein